MRVLDRIDLIRKELDAARAGGQTVGLVPTMGFLHRGHASLIHRSAGECDLTAVTIFVNPLQFGPGEDFTRYPRDLDGDAELAAAAGASVVFAPPVEEMYPQPLATRVEATGPEAQGLEADARPGHFSGVATVVAKLLCIAGPCRAYFGEKDYQQLLVVRRLASDLSFPVEIVPCPTVREDDGVACSSRNAYLSAEERAAATVLHRALTEAGVSIAAGERRGAHLRALMQRVMADEPLVRPEYAEVADAATLAPLDHLAGDVRLLVAARVGSTRLIDNEGVTVQ